MGWSSPPLPIRTGIYATFIDGGFLKAEGAKALRIPREHLQVDGVALMDWVQRFRAYSAADQLLRAYWYDAIFDADDPRHASQRAFFNALDSTPGLEVRLGHLVERTPGWHYPLKQALVKSGANVAEFEKHFQLRPDVAQKGVDALITLDLVHHADTRSYDWALLVAGDRDLVEAVWSVQNEGRHVVVAIPEGAGIATELKRRADQLHTISKDDLARILVPRSAKKGKP